MKLAINLLRSCSDRTTARSLPAPRTFAAAMHRSAILIFILTLLAPVAQAQPGSELNRTDEQGKKQGAWAKSWPNGTLRYEGQFKDDLPVGEFKHYNEDGLLTTTQVYRTDGRSSLAKHFHPDGSLMAIGKYAGKEKDSTWTYFDLQGKTRKVEQFKEGKLHGEQITYYPNGQVADKSTYEMGVITGPSKSWFPSGILASEETYVNGVANGKSILNHPSGKRELEGNLVKGEREGTWLHFNSDGSLHMRLMYKNGELVKEHRENGTFNEYYGDEQPKSEVTYRNGKKEGPFVEYYNNGTWELKQVPPDPATGAKADVERVLIGQTRKREGTYKNNELHGEVKEYDEKGKLVKKTKYEDGVLVEP